MGRWVMETVVENLRNTIVLLASMLGFAAQAAPYIPLGSVDREASSEIVIEDVYRASPAIATGDALRSASAREEASGREGAASEREGPAGEAERAVSATRPDQLAAAYVDRAGRVLTSSSRAE